MSVPILHRYGYYASHYNLYTVESKAAHAHFRSLMLICAHLRHDKYAVEQLKGEVLGLLMDIQVPEAAQVRLSHTQGPEGVINSVLSV